MSDQYLGEIRAFGCTFVPRNWQACDGTLLPTASNTALFSLLGTTYGGDGTTTFAVPDLRGRAGIHVGTGPGLSTYTLGNSGGVEKVQLTLPQLPRHVHAVTAQSGTGNSISPVNAVFAASSEGQYTTAAPDSVSAPLPLAGSTNPNPHENRMPYLGMIYAICIAGIFPSRN